MYMINTRIIIRPAKKCIICNELPERIFEHTKDSFVIKAKCTKKECILFDKEHHLHEWNNINI